jgi:hypothetical protein
MDNKRDLVFVLVASVLLLILVALLSCVPGPHGPTLSPKARAALTGFAECGQNAATTVTDIRSAIHDGGAAMASGEWMTTVIDALRLAWDAGTCVEKIIAAERAAHVDGSIPSDEAIRIVHLPLLARVAELGQPYDAGAPRDGASP